jgi:hypothetical protein
MDWVLVGTFFGAVLAGIVSFAVWPKDRRSFPTAQRPTPAGLGDETVSEVRLESA